jgi:hypothetical protein
MILAEYLQTVFIFDAEPSSGWPKEFAIVTACNPFSGGATDEADQTATEELSSRLREDGWDFHPVTGASRDRSHHEPGFAVWGLSLDQAIALGKCFHQNAIFWVSDGSIYVVSCSTPDQLLLGQWAHHIG